MNTIRNVVIACFDEEIKKIDLAVYSLEIDYNCILIIDTFYY